MNWDWRQWTHIGDEFATILGRMLSVDPEDRYQSALEVERDLQSIEIREHQPGKTLPTAGNRLSTMQTVAIMGPIEFSAKIERNKDKAAITVSATEA